MTDLPKFIRRLLRVSLAWKIAGANAILTIALATGFYVLPSAMTGPALTVQILIGAMLAAAVVNIGLITLALRPLYELETAAGEVWSGASAVRIPSSRLADREVRRVANTINGLLEELQRDRAHLRNLTEKLIAARSSERAAFAYELTESIAQSVAALAFELCALKRAANGSVSVHHLERLGNATTTLVEEIRRLARDVYPRHLDSVGLESALRALVREAEINGTRTITFSTRGDPAGPGVLGRDVADTLYDVAREALRNARQYSGAARVDVSLGLDGHMARLTVSDNGCGFTYPIKDVNRGLGLSLIRERMALVGGTLEVMTQPGKGTRIEAVVPRAKTSATQLQTHAIGARTW